MIDTSKIERADEYILANLPATFGYLVRHAPDDWEPLIDRRLQNLRRKGLIAYKRDGRTITWERVP